jgi:hypothetical protein
MSPKLAFSFFSSCFLSTFSFPSLLIHSLYRLISLPHPPL